MENQGQAYKALKVELAELRAQISELELSKSRLEEELLLLKKARPSTGKWWIDRRTGCVS